MEQRTEREKELCKFTENPAAVDKGGTLKENLVSAYLLKASLFLALIKSTLVVSGTEAHAFSHYLGFCSCMTTMFNIWSFIF